MTGISTSRSNRRRATETADFSEGRAAAKSKVAAAGCSCSCCCFAVAAAAAKSQRCPASRSSRATLFFPESWADGIEFDQISKNLAI